MKHRCIYLIIFLPSFLFFLQIKAPSKSQFSRSKYVAKRGGPKETRPDLKGLSPGTRDLNFVSAVLARGRARFDEFSMHPRRAIWTHGALRTREIQLPSFPWTGNVVDPPRLVIRRVRFLAFATDTRWIVNRDSNVIKTQGCCPLSRLNDVLRWTMGSRLR